MPNTETVTKRTWRTIDYIGGGFVLQVRMKATVEREYRRTYNGGSRQRKLQSAKVVKVEDDFEVDVDNDNYLPIRGVHQRHRIVHLSDLEGVEMAELLQDVEERGGLK